MRCGRSRRVGVLPTSSPAHSPARSRERFTELESALVIHAVAEHGTDWMAMRTNPIYEWRESRTSADLKVSEPASTADGALPRHSRR